LARRLALRAPFGRRHDRPSAGLVFRGGRDGDRLVHRLAHDADQARRDPHLAGGPLFTRDLHGAPPLAAASPPPPPLRPGAVMASRVLWGSLHPMPTQEGAARPSAGDPVANALDLTPRDLLIAGRWRPATDSRRLPVEDPATGETLCFVADADPADCLAA